jgi:UDP-GlcNAc:undecaprenyl-phosphate GlcNAc-1-phosphate transferase
MLILRWAPTGIFDQRIQALIAAVPNITGRILLLYVGAAVVFAIGVVDDVKSLSVPARLILETIVAAILVSGGVRPSLEFLPGWIAGLVGILWIVGIINAFNFLDGLDGLASGIAFIATSALFITILIGDQPMVACFIAALGGTIFGGLLYNVHPARVFLGSSGSLLLGYLMAVATLMVTYTTPVDKNWLMPLLTPIFIMIMPLYDTTSVVLIRLLQKRPLGMADQSHFHHRLLKIGFSHRQAVGFIWLISFAVGMSAVLLVHASMFQSLIILFQIVSITMVLVTAERVAARFRTAQRPPERSGEPTVASVESVSNINEKLDS